MDEKTPYDGSLYHGFFIFSDTQKIAKIPSSWVEWFGNRVSNIAVFRGDSKNIFNIMLTKEKDGWAFTNGVKKLLRHYVLDRGSWVKVFYLGGSEFFVQLMNKELIAVKDYHQRHHHYEFGWKNSERLDDPYDSDPDSDNWNLMECSYIHIYFSHFIKNRKALPTQFVRDAILPLTPASCILRDQNRRRFFCEYQFCKHNDEHCTLTGGWLDFVHSNNLSENSAVRLGILKGDPSVIHAKVIRTPAGGKFKIEKKTTMKGDVVIAVKEIKVEQV